MDLGATRRDASVLSPLQQQLLELVRSLPEAEQFALAGGAALILHGTVERATNDLDFFVRYRDMPPGAIARLVEATERSLSVARLSYSLELVTDTFARLVVYGKREECRVEFAADARIRELDRTQGIPLLSLDELAADKMLALFGRAAARDFQDVAALLDVFTWSELFALASEKDSGFNRERFLEALEAFNRLDAEEFDLPLSDYERLREEVHVWLEQLGGRDG